MSTTYSKTNGQPASNKTNRTHPAFNMLSVMLLLVVAGSALFLTQYHPAQSTPQPQITFDQKMAYLEAGKPLPQQNTTMEMPRWLIALVLGFAVLQILPLLLAASKAQAAEFTFQELRRIEFLTETPLYLGLLGSLVGVCITQFISGSLAAPIAYLTTITGILLYLYGRYTIFATLPSATERE